MMEDRRRSISNVPFAMPHAFTLGDILAICFASHVRKKAISFRMAPALPAVFSFPSLQCPHRDDGLRAMQAFSTLQTTWYNSSDGLWDDLWWNSANCLTTIANLQGSNPSNASFIEQTRKIYESSFRGGLAFVQTSLGKGTNSWTNNFYDDEGWWALAWIRAHDVTGNQTYLETAQTIYADMKDALDQSSSCGALIWQKDRNLVSAIENLLYIDIAAKLAMRAPTGKEEYFSDALTRYQWIFNQSGLVNDDNFIVDGIDPATCTAYTRLLTYNQGAAISALMAIYHASGHERSYLISPPTLPMPASITSLGLTPAF